MLWCFVKRKWSVHECDTGRIIWEGIMCGPNTYTVVSSCVGYSTKRTTYVLQFPDKFTPRRLQTRPKASIKCLPLWVRLPPVPLVDQSWAKEGPEFAVVGFLSMDDEAGSSLTRTNEASRSEAMLEVIIGVLRWSTVEWMSEGIKIRDKQPPGRKKPIIALTSSLPMLQVAARNQ